MNGPFRAGAAMCGKLHTRGGQPFGDVASVIHAHKKEGYAAHMGGI